MSMPANNSSDKRQSMPAQFQMQHDCDSSSYRGSALGDGQEGEGGMMMGIVG